MLFAKEKCSFILKNDLFFEILNAGIYSIGIIFINVVSDRICLWSSFCK